MRSVGRRPVLLVLGILLLFGCLLAPIAILIAGLFLWTGDDGLRADPIPRGSAGETVVFVAVDDLRRDHLSFHGYGFDPTPTLSRRARTGIVAEDFVPASTATAPSLAALLTGLGPAETGFLSARALGAHRLPRAVPTLAEELREAGWRTAAAFALPQDLDRLTGLARGFQDVLEAPLAGPPLSASAAAAGLVELVREVRASDPLLAFLHLGDLRADLAPTVGAERTAAWLARHLAPFRGGDAELAAEIDGLHRDPAGAVARIEQLVGRKRGSAPWLALQAARYDARLETLDLALGELFRALGELGRTDPLVIVAGTRGRLLGVEPPEDGPPIALSEALLATALVVAGPVYRAPPDGSSPRPWHAIDHATEVAPTLLWEVLGREGPSGTASRFVAAGESGLLARVARAHKDLRDERGDRRCFDRSSDRPAPVIFSCPDGGLSSAVARLGSAWELAVAPEAQAGMHLRLGSVSDGITGTSELSATSAHAPPTGRSADLRFDGAAFTRVSVRAATTPLTLTISGGGADLAVALPERGEPPQRERSPEATPGPWTAATLQRAVPPLVSGLPPVFPARPVEAALAATLPATPDGAEPAGLHVVREGGWRRVALTGVRAEDEVELALWLYPPHAGAAGGAGEPEVERVRGVVSVATFPGLGAVVVGGRGPLELRIALAAGQRLAVAAEVAGVPFPAAAMTSDEGGDPADLALYLPPVDLLAFDVTAAGTGILRGVRVRPGRALEPPYGLTADDVRLLRRLGPLE